MSVKRFLAVAVTTAVLAAGSVYGAEYSLDKVHSELGFSVKHLGVSKVRGSFNDYDGVIKWDAQRPEKSYFEGTAKVKSIETKNQKRDEHLRSSDFFSADQYPVITFKSKKIEKKDNVYHVTGDFTLKGVSKEVSFPLTVNGPIKDFQGKERLGFEGGFTINRQDYGMAFNALLESGALVVGNEVDIHLLVEAIKN